MTVSTSTAFGFSAAITQGGAATTLYAMATHELLFIRDGDADSDTLILVAEQPLESLLIPLRKAALGTGKVQEHECVFSIEESTSSSTDRTVKRLALGRPFIGWGYFRVWDKYISGHVRGLAYNDGTNTELFSDLEKAHFVLETSDYGTMLGSCLDACEAGALAHVPNRGSAGDLFELGLTFSAKATEWGV